MRRTITSIIILLIFIMFSTYIEAKKEPKRSSSKKAVSKKKSRKGDKIKANLYSDGKNNYATSKAVFSVIAKDKVSSVRTIMVKIDDGKFVDYKTPVKIDKEGLHKIIYYSVDSVGNKSEEGSYDVIIDNTSPDAQIEPSIAPVMEKDVKYVPGNAEFRIVAKDEYSGVKAIEESIDNGKFKKHEKPIVFKKQGEHKIRYRAIDNLENKSEEKIFTLFVDSIKPSVKIIPSGKLYEKDNEKFAPANYTYKVEVENKESSLSKILIALDGGQYSEYTAPLQIKEEGKHTIKAKAIDNVGNESTEEVLVVTMDNTPPDIDLVPSKK